MTRSFREMQRIVDGLGYDFRDFDLEHFIDHIAQRRQRKIVVRGWKLQRELFAVLVPGEQMDFIAYNLNHHRIQQIHAILHEIAHLVLEHGMVPLKDVISPDLLEAFDHPRASGHARTLFSRQQDWDRETEAENFVYAIQKRVLTHQRFKQLVSGSSTIPAFKPYSDGMGFRD